MEDFDQGGAELLCSLGLFGDLGDRVGESDVHCSLGRLFEAAGSPREALQHTEAALEIYREIGDRSGEAVALSNIGWLRQPRRRTSLAYCRQSLEALPPAPGPHRSELRPRQRGARLSRTGRRAPGDHDVRETGEIIRSGTPQPRREPHASGRRPPRRRRPRRRPSRLGGGSRRCSPRWATPEPRPCVPGSSSWTAHRALAVR
ncbi:MAG: tetratricopeptide repeat protein [Nocardioides sp.]